MKFSVDELLRAGSHKWKKEEVDLVCQILREEMSAAADLKVPLEIDVNIGTNWYESK